jgi:hypothetical protein
MATWKNDSAQSALLSTEPVHSAAYGDIPTTSLARTANSIDSLMNIDP